MRGSCRRVWSLAAFGRRPFQTLETFTIMSRQSRPFSRRQFGQLALAGGAGALAWPNAVLAAHKVRIGVQSVQLPLAAARGRAQGDEGRSAWPSASSGPATSSRARRWWRGPDGRQRPPEGWRDELRDVAR